MRQLILATILSGATLFAHADDATELRQGYFKLIKYEFGDVMGAMLQKKRPMDQALFAEAAIRLDALAGAIDELFPEGSDGPDSRAKAQIWSDSAEFNRVLTTWQSKVSALNSAVQSQDPSAIGAAFKATAASCKECHNNFRSE